MKYKIINVTKTANNEFYANSMKTLLALLTKMRRSFKVGDVVTITIVNRSNI